MSADTIIATGSAAAALLSALLMWRKYRAAGKAQDSAAVDRRASLIAKETADELARVYARLDKLEGLVEELRKKDAKKQTTIDEQTAEIGHMKSLVVSLCTLIVAYAARVQAAWGGSQPMPVFKPEEWAVLEDSLTREQMEKLARTKDSS